MVIIHWLRRILGGLFSSELWITLGYVLLAVLIWGYGPLVSIADVHPLQSVWARVVAIALLALIWLLRRRHRWPRMSPARNRILQRQLRPSTAEPADPGKAKPGVSELQRRVLQAIQLLRQARPERLTFGYWLNRINGQYRYRLPWYLVVGGRGAGKSQFLLGIDAIKPSLQAGGDSVPESAHGLPAWHLGDLAVMIDTPGQFIAATEAHAERDELNHLLRKQRPRQPLNGLLLLVDISGLLAVGSEQRVADGTLLRQHLQHLQADFHINLPIYVIFSKLDRLAGFQDYFHGLGREGREQVWGFTFTRDESQSDGLGLQFQGEMASLVSRLEDGLLDIVSGEPELRSRGMAYLFPQQFASLSEPLRQWLAALARPSQFESRLWIRGAYFGSARRGGAAIERILEPTRPALQLPASVPVEIAAASQTYFLHNLWHQLILPEAGLAGINRRLQLRYRLWHAASLVVLGSILVAVSSVWINSYRHNRDYLHEVAEHAERFKREQPSRIRLPAGDIVALDPLLEQLLQLPASRSFDIHAPPFYSYRAGLYQGRKIQAASQLIYQRALDEKLLPQAATRIHQLLANAPSNDMEYTYDALRAYLMLYQNQHYDADFLSAWLLLDVEKSLSEGITQADKVALEAHVAALFQPGPLTSPFPYDGALVGSIRERLARYSLAERAYHQLKRRLLRSMPGDPVSVDSAGGPQASGVFTRRSGRPLTDGIPPLYTYRGYWEVFSKQIGHSALDLEKQDAWVLDSKQAPLWNDLNRDELRDQVKRLYFNDYIRAWDDYLNDLTIIDTSTVNQSMLLARTLSAPDSPLRRFMQIAARETTLLRDSQATEQRSLMGRAQARIGVVKQSLTDIFGNQVIPAKNHVNEARLEHLVDDHFEPLHRIVNGSGSEGNGPSPMDGSLHVVDELYSYLTATDAALTSGSPLPPSDVFNKLQAEAGRMPSPYRQIMTSLSSRGSTQVTGAVQRSIDQDASATIGRLCQQTIAGRYPFVRSASRDVAIDDFSRMFAPEGLIDRFFQKNLAARVDMNSRRWSFRPDANGNPHGDPRLLGAFQNAETIRNVFFASGTAQPNLKFEVTPLDLDPGINQFTLNVDGQLLRYSHGPEVAQTISWPATGGGGQVRLEISPADGSDSLQTQGPWALQRLFDAADLSPGDAPENFTASFHFGRRRLLLKVTANSAFNPFRLAAMSSFVCPQ